MVRADTDGELERLLVYLEAARGFDYSGYKRASLSRRVQRRMQAVGAEDYAAYIGTLEANPAEFAQLFDTILINVTSFRRDPEVWDFLEREIVPQVVAAHRVGGPIRVWSAGTSSGEEAYTLAVVLAEALGEDRFATSVKIYATDADDDAIAQARRATYATAAVTNAFGAERTTRFFEVDGASCVFRRDLRRSLVFGRHDLAQDPPISRVDLVVSRNTVMYFTTELQRRVLAGFHFALGDGGYLVLGKSEGLAAVSDLFEVVDLERRVFRRRGVAAHPLAHAAPVADGPGIPYPGGELLRNAFDEQSVAEVVVDGDGDVVAANRQARALFGLGADAVGRPLKDLELSYRPVELRSLVESVRSSGAPSAVRDVDWAAPGGERDVLDVVLRPIAYEGTVGVAITFVSVGGYKTMRAELETSRRQLESAYEELRSTVEELETTNEELHSSNEELETMNEELRSSNEELETMNEELQATNDELHAANGELRDRGRALDEANRYLTSILGTLGAAVAVLDLQLTVRAWNRRAEDLWGVRADEVVGANFLRIAIGLPVDQLRAPIRACLSGVSDGAEAVVEAVTRRGGTVECAVRITPLHDGGDVFGVIVAMEA